MTTSDDPDLILKAAAGGAYGAFEQLVKLFDRRLKLACKRVCWPPVDFEDVAQIVWTEAFASIGRFNDADGLRKWLTSTASRRAIDEWRKLKNIPVGAEAAAEITDLHAKDGLEMMINQEQAQAYQERIQALRDCFDRENPAVEAFLLKHLEGLSYDEISSKLSIPSGTIASRISRGRVAIAKCMEGRLS